MADNERIYTIPLGAAYDKTRVRRARRAVKMVRTFLCRHMKAEEGTVRISEKANELLFARGMQKPPRKLKVRVVRADGIVKAYLMDEKPVEKKEAKKGAKKEEKPKEGPQEKEAPKKEEKKPEAAKEKAPAAAKEAPHAHTHEKKG
jgi:large subunit ribosomal protein L31e